MQSEELRKQHQNELLAQISAREEARRLARTQQREAGKHGQQSSSEYVSRVEAIKQKKLAELRDAGVPAKYCAELAKYKVGESGH